MDPSARQRIASYHALLDQSDALIARWFAAASAAPDPPDPAPLSSMVLTLRRLIDTRSKLEHWECPSARSTHAVRASPPNDAGPVPVKADPADLDREVPERRRPEGAGGEIPPVVPVGTAGGDARIPAPLHPGPASGDFTSRLSASTPASNPSSPVVAAAARVVSSPAAARPRSTSHKESADLLRALNQTLDKVWDEFKQSRPPPRLPRSA